jgi:hypothetical protein
MHMRRHISAAMLGITWTEMAGRWMGRGEPVACHYATSRKVAGSSPDEVIGFFQLP